MKRIMIQTISKPDIPNVNNVVYTRNVWNEFISSIPEGEYKKIPITIEKNDEWCKTGIPRQKIIGFTSKITDTYIIVDLLDSVFENDEITAIMNRVANMINAGDLKAYMNYFGDINQEPNMAHKYVDKILGIFYFNIGRADPHDMRPVEVTIK